MTGAEKLPPTDAAQGVASSTAGSSVAAEPVSSASAVHCGNADALIRGGCQARAALNELLLAFRGEKVKR